MDRSPIAAYIWRPSPGLRLMGGALAVLMVIILAACGRSPTAGRAAGFVCHYAYRPSVTVPLSSEGSLSIPDGDTAEYAGAEPADLVFHAQYWSGTVDGERALRLWVTAAGLTDPLTSHLYQLPQDSGPIDQFIGGHGFTGLHYVYHPDSGAELQFWCAVGE